jgi:hypothetical protein
MRNLTHLLGYWQRPGTRVKSATDRTNCAPGWRLLVIGTIVSAAAIAHAQETEPSSRELIPTEILEAYHATMSTTPVPGKGCFTVSYPSTVWVPTACAAASHPLVASASGEPTEVVGNGNDYIARVTTGTISSTIGSFKQITGITSESDGATNNVFSLQINSNSFDTPMCRGTVNPTGCKGWQQFVYSNWGNVFMQYWLLEYGYSATNEKWECPSGWTPYGHSCVLSTPVRKVPVQSIVNLAKLRLTAIASAKTKTDTVIVTTPLGTVEAYSQDSVLDLAPQWQSSEFNIFGDSGGSQANFNGGLSIVVENNVNNGTTIKPQCVPDRGSTAETSNLSFTAGCTAAGGGSPAIKFTEFTPPTSIWAYTSPACSGDYCPGWQMLDDNGDSVRLAGGGGYFYQLHNTGKIWRYENIPCSGTHCPGWALLDNSPDTAQIAASGPYLYQLHNTGKVDYYTGSQWEQLDNNSGVVTIAASAGNLYELHNKGEIWRYTGSPCSGNSCRGWQELDNNPAAVAIAAGGDNLYQLHSDGSIWQYTGIPCEAGACYGWQRLDRNPATLEIVADGNSLYQLHSDGSIWRYTDMPCNGNNCFGWLKLDNNPAAVDIAAADGALFELHNTGGVWEYTGTPCSGNACYGWKMLDDNPLTGRISAGSGMLYQMHIHRVSRELVRTCYECR